MLENITFSDEMMRKHNLIRDLDIALRSAGVRNVENYRHELWVYDAPGGDLRREYVVVTYKGGAVAVRNNSGNSISATLESAAGLVDGGYYSEVRTYENMIKDGWQRVDFTAATPSTEEGRIVWNAKLV